MEAFNPWVLAAKDFPSGHTEATPSEVQRIIRTEEGLIVNYDELMPEADRLLASEDPQDNLRGIELRRELGFPDNSHLGDGK
jgi:hypothetical protein